MSKCNCGIIWSLDDDNELIKEAAKAIERMKKRSQWPTEELVNDLVDAGEKEYLDK